MSSRLNVTSPAQNSDEDTIAERGTKDELQWRESPQIQLLEKIVAIETALEAGAAVLNANGDRHATNVLPIIEEIRKSGKVTRTPAFRARGTRL
jgi:hypothetical protein